MAVSRLRGEGARKPGARGRQVRAMQIIDTLEPSRRGPYGGGIGHVSFTGGMDMALALRTMARPRRAARLWRSSVHRVQACARRKLAAISACSASRVWLGDVGGAAAPCHCVRGCGARGRRTLTLPDPLRRWSRPRPRTRCTTTAARTAPRPRAASGRCTCRPAPASSPTRCAGCCASQRAGRPVCLRSHPCPRGCLRGRTLGQSSGCRGRQYAVPGMHGKWQCGVLLCWPAAHAAVHESKRPAQVPEAEYDETVNKAAALGRAIDLAEQAFLDEES
jgi:hypothetical protein